MTREERSENRQWNEADHDLKKAYNQFSDFEWKVELAEPNRAARHLEKSLNDFRAAMTHVAKADVGESQKGAVDALNRGVDQLSDAVTALDDGSIDSAERHYDNAAGDFNKAAGILGY